MLPAGYGPFSNRPLMSSSRQSELFNPTSRLPRSSSSASPTGSDQSTSSTKRTVEWPREFFTNVQTFVFIFRHNYVGNLMRIENMRIMMVERKSNCYTRSVPREIPAGS